VTGIIKLDAVIGAIDTKFAGELSKANIAAAKAAYEMVQSR
jgi:Pyruvate/2-oxoacid:ferredoxin oxidoreductase gamma subunit